MDQFTLGARAAQERIIADKLAAVRAEIALVSGVVQALAITVHITTDSHIFGDGGEAVEWERQRERLRNLLKQERELMGTR